MTKKGYVIVGVISAIGAILFALLIYFMSMTGTYKTQLENNYRRAFYELSNNLQSIELDLSKLVATNDASIQRDILNEIYQISNTANGNLSALPVANEKIKNVNRYLNTLGGYSFSLLEDINNGGKLDKSQLENITWLHKSSKIANYDIKEFINTKSFDNSIVENVKYSDGDSSDYDAGLTNVNSANSTMPTLIYDGPFSDSVVNKKIKGLSGDIISVDNAYEIVQDVFTYFDNYSITYVGDTDGKFATYNFELQAGNYKLYVQITKLGGFILSVNNIDNIYVSPKLDNDSAQILAENYLTLLGFKNMQCVWTQDMDNVVYFNFAYYKDDIVYYPDLIKVKVDKGLEKVIGMDASNYAYNHTSRDKYVQNISIEDAKNNLSPVLTVKSIQKCVIPNKWVGESDAYQFECTWQEYTYFVYLSSDTGKELNIVRLVDTTSGELTQ